MSLGEFELIRRYFSEASTDASVVLGIGDDCAVLAIPPGQQLAVSIDTLVEGTHFLPGTAADLLASRLFGSALSDLAAMGARPAWLTLALTLPQADSTWLQAFSERLAQLCAEYQVALVGGDTTQGPMVLSAQVHGFLPAGERMTRAGARTGDLICTSGYLGDSRGGLESLLHGVAEDADREHIAWLEQRFYVPSPRIELGLSLRQYASSCIDISDGLLADLGHVLRASGDLGCRLDVTKLPLSEALVAVYGEEQARQWALTGGEDFELCFTLPPQHREAIAALPVTVIGEVTAEPGIELLLHGAPYRVDQRGYEHFHSRND